MSATTQTQIVNFRKMRQDFATQPLREGKDLFSKGVVKQAKVVQFGAKVIKIHAEIVGAFGNVYTCEMEIDRLESEVIDSSCDCPNTGDCQHLACLIFHLEEDLENLVFGFSQRKKNTKEIVKEGSVKEIDKVVVEIEKKVEVRQKKELEKQQLDEYITAATVLGKSAFFVPAKELNKDQGELSILFAISELQPLKQIDVQLVLRLPFRSKPFYIQQPKQFFLAIQAQEAIVLGGRHFVFGLDSFGPFCEELIKALRPHLHFTETKTDKGIVRLAELDREGFGEVLATAHEYADKYPELKKEQGKGSFSLPGICWQSQEKPLFFFENRAAFCFTIDYFSDPLPHLILSPSLKLEEKGTRALKEATIFECSRPGVFIDGLYYRFPSEIKRQHIHDLELIQNTSIPEPLFGSFIENALHELQRFGTVRNSSVLDKIVTYPSPDLKAIVELSYSNSELEASLRYIYDENSIPEAHNELTLHQIKSFITKEGVLARSLVEENALVRDLFAGFIKDEKTGAYLAKTDKKIVEFMTEIVPQFGNRVQFSYPENLQNQFSYDDTHFTISLSESKSFDSVILELSVDGSLKGLSVDFLWDCVASKRSYIVLNKKGGRAASDESEGLLSGSQKILVLKLDLLAITLQIFDELQIKQLDNFSMTLPLWVLVNLLPARFEGSLITLKQTARLKQIQEQIFDINTCKALPLPKSIQASFRPYQEEGIAWLSRLRQMGLNGILADDMGLGKTLQAIAAIAQYFDHRKSDEEPPLCLIVCPTSLVDNWKEEFNQFQPTLRIMTCVGAPQERRKLINNAHQCDVIVTSYGLVQKDIELYEKLSLGYLILDEAQAIKNRETRNARSVKKIAARHKLILTGTPLENSMEDLWSLFDFLMPGILGTFDRFVNTYVRATGQQAATVLPILQKKVAPFVLRRMKQDVLKDLPPISHIVYNCRLSVVQQELYSSYAKSAKEQLTKLVEKEGFDKVRLQVLATLTRLKQICCHPAIFAKESAEPGDSAKYEMLLDLLGSLTEAKHKTVVFSQYTQMLSIMREDLQKMGIRFAYLDGSSKNRLSIVKKFNEDPDVSVFLVSLKVGGTGLNIVGADTVIHYDMWWNPAVENQATDRVWRMGQKQAVSSYKLVTLGTIEEKIVLLQNRKKELLKEIVRTDEEAILKLTWSEVLELLKSY